MREWTFTLVYWGFIPSFPTKGQLDDDGFGMFWDGEKFLIHPDRSDRSDTVDPWFFLQLSKIFMNSTNIEDYHSILSAQIFLLSLASISPKVWHWVIQHTCHAGIHHFSRVSPLAIAISIFDCMYCRSIIWSTFDLISKVSPSFDVLRWLMSWTQSTPSSWLEYQQKSIHSGWMVMRLKVVEIS